MIDLIAGSCSAESLEESMKQAEFLNSIGVDKMRFMMWKPRTSPESYQGIGYGGLIILEELYKKFPHMSFVIEVLSGDHFRTLSSFVTHHSYLDDKSCYKCPNIIYQIGSRNAQNFELLKELGTCHGLTILYKRGMWQTIDEYVDGSKYLNPEKNNIILCLRGIRTFETSTRNTADIDAICVLKERFEYVRKMKYKVIFDPSHASGNRKYIIPLSLAAIAAGADGLEIEIHSNPDEAISDAKQTISFDEFKQLKEQIAK